MERFGYHRVLASALACALATGITVLYAPGATAQGSMEMPVPPTQATAVPGQSPAPAPMNPAEPTVDVIPPADYVAGSVVRVQTWAQVSVVVHHVKLYKVELEPHADPRLAGTGFFVNPGGAIATASDVINVDRPRLETWGINQAFARTFGTPVPADPYAQTHSPDPEIDEHLQGCYNHEQANSECAVFVSTETRAYPYQAPPIDAGLLVTPIAQSGPLAVLSSTAGGDVTTAALATEPSTHWTYVGWTDTPKGDPPVTLSGDFPSIDMAMPADALAQLVPLAGSGLRGSVLVDDRGRILDMLQVVDGRPVTVPATDIATTMHNSGIEVRPGPVDTQMTTGLDYVASHEYANAEPYLAQAAASTDGQAVALKYLDVARQKKDTADDQSGMAGSHTGTPLSTGSNWAITGAIAAAVIALVAVCGFLWWRRRDRVAGPKSTPEPELTAVGATPAPAARPAAAGPMNPGHRPVREPDLPRTSNPAMPMTMPAPPPGAGNGQTMRRDEGHTVVHRKPTGEGDTEFCPQCGANLAPGDRFCFSCGTPARRQVGR
jgi:hypothetical protein